MRKWLAIGVLFTISLGSTIALAADVRHSFFVAGPDFTGIVNEDGKRVWDSGQAGARDGWVLPNGNILIAWGKLVREFTPEKEVVFEYQLDTANKEIGTVERLDWPLLLELLPAVRGARRLDGQVVGPF